MSDEHLDRVDIEAEGWYGGGEVKLAVLRNGEPDDFVEGYELNINEADTAILHYEKEKIHIYLRQVYNQNSGNWTMQTIFLGVIKNRSELHRIMQQTGIIR